MYEVLAYVYKHYERADLAYDGDRVARKLSSVGFGRDDIYSALRWLAGMRAPETQEDPAVCGARAAQRIYAPRELDRLDAGCLGYLLTLEHSGVLNARTREQVLERALAAGDKRLGLDQLKVIILMVLWNQGLATSQLLAHDLFLISESRLPS